MALPSKQVDQLTAALKNFMPLTDKFISGLLDLISIEHRKKGIRILNEREIQLKIWFIIKGSARSYKDSSHLSQPEQTLWFWFVDDIILNPGFFSQQATENSIELLEDSQLACIDIKNFSLLKKDLPETEPLFEKIRYHYIKLWCLHADELKSLSTKDRYLKLFKTNPMLFNHARQKDIANFLRMTPDTLARHKREK